MALAAVLNNAAVELINRDDRFSQQPESWIMEIFSFLPMGALANLATVSRRWKRLSTEEVLWNTLDLKTIFPQIRVLNWAVWTHAFGADRLFNLGVDGRDEPKIPQRQIIPAIMRLLASNQIENYGSIACLTMPRGLTHNILVEIARSPENGNLTRFRSICDEFIRKRGDQPQEATSVVLITENVFVGSRQKQFIDQQALLKQNGCTPTTVLESSALTVLVHNMTGECLLVAKFTCCSDQLSDSQMAVGGFSSGIGVFSQSDRRLVGVIGVLSRNYTKQP